MYCHDLDVMSWNPGRVELGVRSTSAQVVLEPKISLKIHKCPYRNTQMVEWSATWYFHIVKALRIDLV